MTLTIRLLGGFQVELDGRAVQGFESDKARALLAYLAADSDRPHRRDSLAALPSGRVNRQSACADQ